MLKTYVRALQKALEPEWPVSRFDKTVDPKIYFLLTPPNSGSTAIADFFCQIDYVTGLQKKYEGQWLVKGMRARDRWQKQKLIDYDSVRSVWINKFMQLARNNPTINSILEKSPPNLVRYEALRRAFPNSLFVVNNRNPYAYVSSQFRRYHEKKIRDLRGRKIMMENLAKQWIIRSRLLQDSLHKDGFPLLTYECFCEDPTRIFSAYGLESNFLKINSNYAVKVKDYDKQIIRNLNSVQIDHLEEYDIDVISKILRSDADLLQGFGYEMI